MRDIISLGIKLIVKMMSKKSAVMLSGELAKNVYLCSYF